MANTNKPYILIVDDLEENLILLEQSLKSFDADVIKVASGEKALSIVKNSTPALALIDVMMPDMNGYQLAKKIIEDKNRDIIPIIFITAINQNETDIFKGYESGAIDYIFKPINKFILQNKVRLFLEIGKQKHEAIINKNKIEESQKLLRAYANRLQQIREEERTNIAREIHDEFGQVLTALKMNLTILGNEVKDPEKTFNKAEIVDEINNMNKIIDTTIHHVRLFTNKLRPDVLDNFGLVEALDTHIYDFCQLYKLKCNFVKPDEIEIDADKSIAVYRIVQEALTNVARHANATEINISINKKDDFLNVIIEDNGIGIVDNKLGDEKKFGIIGMKERAFIFGGELQIFSTPGKGTKLDLTIPLIKND